MGSIPLKKSQIRGVKKSDIICRWVDEGYLRDRIWLSMNWWYVGRYELIYFEIKFKLYKHYYNSYFCVRLFWFLRVVDSSVWNKSSGKIAIFLCEWRTRTRKSTPPPENKNPIFFQRMKTLTLDPSTRSPPPRWPSPPSDPGVGRVAPLLATSCERGEEGEEWSSGGSGGAALGCRLLLLFVVGGSGRRAASTAPPAGTGPPPPTRGGGHHATPPLCATRRAAYVALPTPADGGGEDGEGMSRPEIPE